MNTIPHDAPLFLAGPAGRIEAAAGLSDAEAYRELADLVYRALETDR